MSSFLSLLLVGSVSMADSPAFAVTSEDCRQIIEFHNQQVTGGDLSAQAVFFSALTASVGCSSTYFSLYQSRRTEVVTGDDGSVSVNLAPQEELDALDRAFALKAKACWGSKYDISLEDIPATDLSQLSPSDLETMSACLMNVATGSLADIISLESALPAVPE